MNRCRSRQLRRPRLRTSRIASTRCLGPEPRRRRTSRWTQIGGEVMRHVSVMAAVIASIGLSACEKTPDASSPAQVPNEKVALTPEQQEEIARAKVLLALLSKSA